MRECKLFINDEWRESSEGKTFPSPNPANAEHVALCHLPSTRDIQDAVEAASQAFHSPEWREMKAEGRSAILLQVAEKIKERAKEIVDLEVRDSGSTLRKAKADVHNAASFFKFMGKKATRFPFEQVDDKASKEGFSKNTRIYEPIGVCAQIIPWNFPLVMAAWKIGPVLATGCTSVLKSAEETPVTAAVLGEILQESGLPKGVVNIITGGAQEGQELLCCDKIDKVAFTGSTQVGREILRSSAHSIRRTTLELGGKSPNIVLGDADLDIAVDGILYAFLYHSGQACDSGTRILVEDALYDEFVEKLLKRIKEVTLGPPHKIETGLGPVINKKQFERIMGFVETAKKEGAKLLCGGKRREEGELAKGYYIEPTLFEVTPKHSIFHEEVFGPVAGIMGFKGEEEAISLANNSHYGLAGAVWTQDEQKAKRVAKRLEAGTIWINEYHLLNPGMPFGGYKLSGLGRELGTEGLLSYLEVKHLWQSESKERKGKFWFDAIF